MNKEAQTEIIFWVACGIVAIFWGLFGFAIGVAMGCFFMALMVAYENIDFILGEEDDSGNERDLGEVVRRNRTDGSENQPDVAEGAVTRVPDNPQPGT
jgi:hypothetical protein